MSLRRFGLESKSYSVGKMPKLTANHKQRMHFLPYTYTGSLHNCGSEMENVSAAYVWMSALTASRGQRRVWTPVRTLLSSSLMAAFGDFFAVKTPLSQGSDDQYRITRLDPLFLQICLLNIAKCFFQEHNMQCPGT